MVCCTSRGQKGCAVIFSNDNKGWCSHLGVAMFREECPIVFHTLANAVASITRSSEQYTRLDAGLKGINERICGGITSTRTHEQTGCLTTHRVTSNSDAIVVQASLNLGESGLDFVEMVKDMLHILSTRAPEHRAISMDSIITKPQGHRAEMSRLNHDEAMGRPKIGDGTVSIE
jgi:hypothetical protein